VTWRPVDWINQILTAPTPASEEKTSTLVKPHRIYSPSKRSTRDFCGIELEDSDFASNESDAEGTRVPPAKRLKRASRSRDEAGDDDHDDNEEEDKKLPGKLDDNNDERKIPANEDGFKEEQSEDEESRNDSNEVIVIDGEGNDDSSNDDEEEEEEVPSVCVHCGATPCVWLKFRPDVVEYACNNQLFNGMTEAEMDKVTEIQRDRKKKCFKYFTRLRYGVLGRNNRMDNKDCVKNGIRGMFPVPNDDFIGYHSS
jgi:hypothetical protein